MRARARVEFGKEAVGVFDRKAFPGTRCVDCLDCFCWQLGCWGDGLQLWGAAEFEGGGGGGGGCARARVSVCMSV